jgi:hypothetical protein
VTHHDNNQFGEGRRMKRFLFVVILTAFASTAFAKPKEQVYAASCDRVWAAVKVATGPPHYNFAQLDDAQKKGIVSTGFSLSKRYLDITLSGSGETCTVAVGGTFSGLAHNDKGDLFKRINDALAQVPTEKAPEAKK